jgi:hypothetical protein
MNIKELTKQVEEAANCKVTWELGKKYIAIDTVSGRVVAEYNLRKGTLLIIK